MTVFSYRRSTPLLIAVLISAVCVWSAWGVPLSPGTLGVQNKDNVTITGGSITGITDIAIADGGTGASTAANARTNLGLDNASNYPAGLLRTDGSAASLTSFPTLNQNTSGTAAGLSATLAIGSGGTGATTASAALTALGGDNASNLSTGTIPAARVPTLNQSTTGTAGGLVFGSDARGDLPVRGASAYGRLLIGTSGKILTTDGTDPAWSAYTVASPGATGAVLTSDGTNWTRNAAPAISAANMTSFPTLNQNTTGTASNVSGTPALPNGTTATSQSAHDNGTKLATTRYVDGRDQFYRFNIDAPAVTDNVMFDGPLFVGITLDNVVFVVTDNTGKRSGASTDNVTVNIIYCGAADNTVAQCTKVFTSDQTPTGAAVLTPALNNTTPGTGNYLRFYVAATNMTNKKLYVRIRYRE